ncbi:hypothetical protein KI387_002045, partial [Taxus chinensis]
VEPAPQLLDHGSISFGRFAIESLAWEKWSSFSQNRCLEEVQRCSAPGSVAKKKAYFEAYYKRIAAQKALQEQDELVQKASQGQALQGKERSDFHFEGEISESNESHKHHVYEDVTGPQAPEQNGIFIESPIKHSHDNATCFQASEQSNEETTFACSIDIYSSPMTHNHENATDLQMLIGENDDSIVDCGDILQVSDKICASSGMIAPYENVIADEEIGEEANQYGLSLLDDFQHEEMLGDDLSLKIETQEWKDNDKVAFDRKPDGLLLIPVSETGISETKWHNPEEIRADGFSKEAEEKTVTSESSNQATFDSKPLLLNALTETGISERKEHNLQERGRTDGISEEFGEKKKTSAHANAVLKKSKQSKQHTLKGIATSYELKTGKKNKLCSSPEEASVNSPQISKNHISFGLRSTRNSMLRMSKSQFATGFMSGNSTPQMSKRQISSGLNSRNSTARKSQSRLPSTLGSSGKAVPRTSVKMENIIVQKGNQVVGNKLEDHKSTNFVDKLPSVKASHLNFTVPKPFALATDKRASKAENGRDKESLKLVGKVLQNRITVPGIGKIEVSSNEVSKLPGTKASHSENGRRLHRGAAGAPKLPVVNNCNKTKQVKDQDHSKYISSIGTVKPKSSPNVEGIGFSFKSNERAEKRKE